MAVDWDARFAGPAVRIPPPYFHRPLDDRLPAVGGRARPVRVVTWNLLAPCWKRTGDGLEEDDEPVWRERLQQQFALLDEIDPDVLLLQEWWHESAAYSALWEEWASQRRMSLSFLPRTSGKPDGCAAFVAESFSAGCVTLDALSFADMGDRVVQMCRVSDGGGCNWLFANTHLTFPHRNDHDPTMRRHQGRKLGEAMAALRVAEPSLRVVLAGDFNGSVTDDAVRAVVDLSGLELHGVEEETHRDHRGGSISCDFVLTTGLRSSEVRLAGQAGCLGTPDFCSDHRPLVVVLDEPDAVQ